MASKESEAVRQHWAAARVAFEQQTSEGDQELADHQWAGLTSEPPDVDYLSVQGRPAVWIVPHDATSDRVLLCLHGGGYVGGSRVSHRKLFAHLARAVGVRALVFDYPLAPEHAHPAQLDDTVDTYRWLLDQGIAAEHILFTGDSVGGAMAITTQLRARSIGLPLPAGAMPFSPAVDFEAAGASYDANRERDAFFDRDLVRGLASLFLGTDGSPDDPFVNPSYGDLTGLGPIYIQVGGDEVLLDDAQLLAAAAEKAGVEVRLDVFPEMQHTFQMAAGRAPEADDAIERMARWARPVLGL
ncbi:alpha/beta hydrolase [Kribbella kalugense]|uniref:Acetyl esterase/lipase n=1 Tax=Kribbella kalugense TaxID=2512221 RepID=A0A4R7ZDD9_9ACTN|nr:alpha/beta hydrolase [Kribbella kalugense]TDW14211.1 acetyl esterase/lipase [Kribbella kalugense]